MKKLIFAVVAIFACISVSAQTYTPKVSKDSLKIINTKIDVLKQNIRVLELKVKEADEEANVEKLRIKLLEANGDAKASLEKREENTDRSSSSNDQDKVNKLAKDAQRDSKDAQRALDHYDKQIKKVEDFRAEITSEERKLTYKKPIIVYDYK
ncbi:hypothetical protein [Pedobacter sp. UYP30]|uniref:hypothetical protein n=1 Tax=Pedobacter sp. UYP30 TaxID=1756400 RepID=UPI0033957592